MFSLIKRTLLLVSLTILVSCMCVNNVRVWFSASGPRLVYYRELPLYDQMVPRLEEYNETLDWKWKVYPYDMPYLNSTNDILDVEVYVLNPKEAEVYSRNRGETQIQTIFYVYQALDEQVRILSQFSPTYLYKSKFTPVVSMKSEKTLLCEVATLPFVYCIRIIPEPKATSLSIDEARTYNDLIHTQSFHDKTVDPMDIAIIGQGYGYPENDDGPPCHLNAEAEDNIEYTWDFVNNDPDVSDGYNAHDTDCLDLLARAFGDMGDDDEMYDNPNIYSVLKIAQVTMEWLPPPRWGWIPHIEWGGEREAIEWCIENDMEVVFMCFTHEPVIWILDAWLPECYCNGWWCDLFYLGVEDGVTWVAGAGNFRADWGVGYPAESHYVIAVGGYESVNETTGEAYRWEDSNYGTTIYAIPILPPNIYCPHCFWGSGGLFYEFKPNVYDAGHIQGVGAGTSYATPLAAACIALGIYSQPSEPTDQAWIPGYNTVHDTIALCNEWAVMPAECSQQGDVIDTNTLWHRSVIDEYKLTILAEDQNGTSLTTEDVYIDDQLAGYTGSTFIVDAGLHTVEVESLFNQNGKTYVFNHWEDNSTDNPRTINLTCAIIIKAYYLWIQLDNWSFEERRYEPYPPPYGNGSPPYGVYECPPWESDNGGWRELRGDVNGDGYGNVEDFVLVKKAVGSYPGHPNWNPDCDINGDGFVNVYDYVLVRNDIGKAANHRDGSYSWYTSGGGDYTIVQWFSDLNVNLTKGHQVTFAFLFKPETVAPDGLENYARAEIYYVTETGSNHTIGAWVYPNQTTWYNPSVTTTIPSDTVSIKVIIHGKPDFKAWIDNATLTIST